MRYDSFIQSVLEIKSTSGDEYYCICPFHEDRNPSFAINRQSGLFFCHGCKIKGNSNQLAELLGTAIVLPLRTIDELEDNINSLTTPTVELENLTPELYSVYTGFKCDFYTDSIKNGGRGLKTETIEKFGLGYIPEAKECTIPVWSTDGYEFLGVIKRKLEGTPKYKYPKGMSAADILFASWIVKEEHPHKLAVVEGPLDAIRCWDADIPAVAVLGSHISRTQLKILKELGVDMIYAFGDDDKAGKQLSEQIYNLVNFAFVEIIEYPKKFKGLDPGSLSRPALRALTP